MDFKFNINNYVKVKLTDYGVSVLKKHHDARNLESLALGGEGLGEFELKVDQDGYYVTQLWKLMSIFGNHMFYGGNISFETNVILVDGEVLEVEEK